EGFCAAKSFSTSDLFTEISNPNTLWRGDRIEHARFRHRLTASDVTRLREIAMRDERICRRWGVFFGLTIYASGGSAQVTLDGTLGPAGPLAGPDYAITADLGRQVGGNLFQVVLQTWIFNRSKLIQSTSCKASYPHREHDRASVLNSKAIPIGRPPSFSKGLHHRLWLPRQPNSP
ncbi:MAG: hypothetical protein R6X18_17510, partial [Chloroflexota bacterium]